MANNLLGMVPSMWSNQNSFVLAQKDGRVGPVGLVVALPVLAGMGLRWRMNAEKVEAWSIRLQNLYFAGVVTRIAAAATS